MADLAPIFRGASGGKSDDIFVGIPDSYQESQSIEIRNNPRGIKLGYKLAKDTGSVITETINCFLKVSTSGDVMAFGSSGGIYRKNGGTWTKNSNTVSGAIISCIEFNGFIYFTNAASLFRVAVGSISNTMTVNIAFQTFTNSVAFHPMTIGLTYVLLIGDKNLVATYNTSSVWSASDLTIGPELTVKEIRTFGSSIKVYAQYTGNATEVAFWDGVSESVQESITLSGIKIEQIVNKDGVDFIISNNNLGILDGYKQSKLKAISDYSKNSKSMDVQGNKLLFGGTGGVWAWSNLNKNYPEVLSFEYKTSNAITDAVGAIFYDGTDLYVAWSNGATYGIDKLSTLYTATGFWTSRVYFAETRTQIKSALEVQSAFAAITGTDSISLYYRLNITGSYTLIKTMTASSVKTNTFTDKTQLSGEFNFIEFKVELNSANGSTSPEFYELFLKYDNVKF